MKICAGVDHLFAALPLVERFDAALAAGFDGVELTLPYGESPGRLAAARERSGAPVLLFTAPVGDFVQGGEGLAAVPGRQARFRDSIAEAREYADALQSRYVQVLAGRGPDDTAGRQRYLDTLLDNLRFACEAFADSDTRVVLEPINTRDFPGYLLSTPAQARELLAALRATRPMLVLDTLHLAVMGVDPAEEIREYAADYAHLQWADAPGRSAPGTGDLNFTALAAAMREAGYRGWVGAEYRPAPGDPDWAAQLRGAWRPG